MANQSTAVDEHEATMKVARMLASAAVEPSRMRRESFAYYQYCIKRLRLPADDEVNALARLREVLGISE